MSMSVCACLVCAVLFVQTSDQSANPYVLYLFTLPTTAPL